MLFRDYLQYLLGTSEVLSQSSPSQNNTCIVRSAGDGDSAPAIEQAFSSCGHNPTGRGKVVFQKNETYNIKTFMNTTYLQNVDIDHQGTLLWSTDIQYWLGASQPVGYQTQSSAWWLGGEGIHWYGHGYGTIDGNGQVWYDFVNGQSNYPKRPHQITIRNTTNSIFEGLRFVQSQMWTMTIISSENILLQDIYVNSTAEHPVSIVNTDGADTIYANNITFRRWVVQNGDDPIALKANSTNILIEDCEFFVGTGLAIGSIGQFNNTYETIQNVVARNITTHNTDWGAYIKTWTGVSKGYSPNGGGGGIGFASNLTFEDFKLDNTRGIFAITQCTNYEGNGGDCDTSKFNIRNINIDNWSGTSQVDVIGQLQCSAAAPCTNVSFEDIDLESSNGGDKPSQYLCDSVIGPQGFNCTGPIVEENNE